MIRTQAALLSPYLGLLAVLACACQSAPPRAAMRTQVAPQPVGEEIVVCGQRIAIGAPVVLWTEPPRYDAYRLEPHFGKPASWDPPSGPRCRLGRLKKLADGSSVQLIDPDSTDLVALRAVVDQFVLHYDAVGTSQGCFRVLQDDRGLSVHFLLDIDGTIYQTLDLRDQASHATKANPRSIGIEIAHVGAYPPGARSAALEWYRRDAGGAYIALPERLVGGDVRTRGFVGRPARPDPVRGSIQGQALEMYDLTPEQYESLIALTVALCRIFPKIEPDAPRDSQGRVETSALADAEFAGFHGILGHYHVQTNKIDPGPAFDWERFLVRVREGLGTTPE